MNTDILRRLALAISIVCLTAGLVFGQPKLVANKVTLKNGKSFNLNLPAELEIVPAAEGLKRVRFFAKSPDGRIFVTDMYNLTDNKRGTVYILDGWDAKAGRFASVTPYLTNLRNPNSVQFYRDPAGIDWLYLAETHKLTRRRFTRGETTPTDPRPETLAAFPDYGLSYKYGGWHLTRTIAFSAAGKLYVSVGSSCNSCVEKERVRASILEMNPDGTESREFARGLRNAVGLRTIGNFVFATNQGSDHLGLQRPDETFYALKEGADYGWPYCHSSNGKIFGDPQFKRGGGCAGVPAPYAYFPSRSSALGFDFFDEADALFGVKGTFVVALHGSTDKAMGHGYKIVTMRKGEPLQDLLTGFLQRGKVMGRPCDIMKLDANSFLFTDDFTGVVYLVRKKGTITPITAVDGEHGVNSDATATNSTASEAPRACLSVVLLLAGVLARSITQASF